MEMLSPRTWPEKLSYLDRFTFRVEQLRIIPSDEWINNRSNQFGYKESFDNKGMMFPIAVSSANPQWVKDRLLLKKDGEFKNPHHIDENGEVVKGLYVHVGNKRVWYAKQHGYTHIEGYLINTIDDREAVKRFTHISHTEIPK